MRPYVFGGRLIAIPVPIIPCPLAGIVVPDWAYRSCPAAFFDPLVGILALEVNLLTRSLWSSVCISKNLVIKMSSYALVSSTAYIVADLSRHHVIHRSLSKVIFGSSQSILGLCPFSYGISRMISWFCRFATCSVANSLSAPISIGTSATCIMGPISLKFPSARYISGGLSAIFVVIWCLSHILLSIKSSVAPESIIALMLTLS